MSHSFFLYTQSNWPSLSSLGQFFYIVLLVAFVALLAYYSTKMLASSRMGRLPGAPKRNLEVIEHVAVGTQAMAQIIRAGEQYFLIGVTKDHITLLAPLDADTLTLTNAHKTDTTLSFDKILRRFMKRAEAGSADDTDEARDDV